MGQGEIFRCVMEAEKARERERERYRERDKKEDMKMVTQNG